VPAVATKYNGMNLEKGAQNVSLILKKEIMKTHCTSNERRWKLYNGSKRKFLKNKGDFTLSKPKRNAGLTNWPWPGKGERRVLGAKYLRTLPLVKINLLARHSAWVLKKCPWRVLAEWSPSPDGWLSSIQSFVTCAVETNLAWNLAQRERLILYNDSA